MSSTASVASAISYRLSALGSWRAGTSSCRSIPPQARPARRAFTLIETALATVIVGVGVLSIVSAQQAFHKQNHWSTHASTATRLANEIREMTLNLPRHDPVTGQANWGIESGNEYSVQDFDDVDDFDGDQAGEGLIFSAEAGNGPLNALRQIIPNMAGWAQIVDVSNVNPNNITDGQANGSTTMMKVEVVVTYQGPNDAEPLEMTRVSWISPN
jgi:hypothetical protein